MCSIPHVLNSTCAFSDGRCTVSAAVHVHVHGHGHGHVHGHVHAYVHVHMPHLPDALLEDGGCIRLHLWRPRRTAPQLTALPAEGVESAGGCRSRCPCSRSSRGGRRGGGRRRGGALSSSSSPLMESCSSSQVKSSQVKSSQVADGVLVRGQGGGKEEGRVGGATTRSAKVGKGEEARATHVGSTEAGSHARSHARWRRRRQGSSGLVRARRGWSGFVGAGQGSSRGD